MDKKSPIKIKNIHQKLIDEVKLDNNERSYKKLITNYEPLIKSLSNKFKQKYKNTPIEMDDIQNVMYFYFYRLVKEYDVNKNKSFPSYIKEFLYFKTSTWLRGYTTLNNQVLNYYENNVDEYESKTESKYDLELLDPKNNPELSKVEADVIKYLSEGYKIKEISKILNRNEKTLYAAKLRALNKIKNNFNE